MNADEWREELKCAIKNGADHDTHRKMIEHAADWCNCAVGAKLIDKYSLEPVPPGNGDSAHIIENLSEYGDTKGMEFHHDIMDRRYKDALDIFEEIQAAESRNIFVNSLAATNAFD